MQLHTVPRSPHSSGSVFFLVGHQLNKWKTYNGCNLDTRFFASRFFYKNQKGNRRCNSKCFGSPISCSAAFGSDSFIPSKEQLSDARLIYSVAPAMGHNQESHPESHLRVPAIVNALEEMKLTSKFRGSEIIELQNFEPASVEDVASVHAKAYVSGLEKAMDQASEKGLIFIDGSGPTYATATYKTHLSCVEHCDVFICLFPDGGANIADIPGVTNRCWSRISLS